MGDLEQEIGAIGREIFKGMEGQSPSVFQRDWWSGKLMDWCMKDESFKIEMFRFVDVFPVLKGHGEVARHIQEYFLREGQNFGFLGAGLGLAASGLGARAGAAFIEKNIISMAKRFISGANPTEAMPKLAELRKQGVGFTVDLLGEATVSETEALAYLGRYTELIDTLTAAAARWQRSEILDSDFMGRIPTVNVSVKVSALYSQIDPMNYDGSTAALKDRVRPIFRRAKERGAFVNLDIEQSIYKNLTIRLFQELLDEDEFSSWDGAGLAIQTYLRDSEADVRGIIKWAKGRKAPITMRLVKGAYWDYETIVAKQRDWPIPVYEVKSDTDANFEACASLVLENSRSIKLASASHNVRTIAHTIAYARKQGLPDNAFEVQMLFGMAEPIKAALCQMGFRTRDYVPVGELIPGMGYFVRRLLENTSNESFLRQRFAEGVSIDELLTSPVEKSKRSRADTIENKAKNGTPPVRPELVEGQTVCASTGSARTGSFFKNEPPADYSIADVRTQMRESLSTVKRGLGSSHSLLINGKERTTSSKLESINPSRPSEVIGSVSQATQAEAEEALIAARRAFPAWRDTSAGKRAEYLFKTADYIRKKRFELASLEVFEAGKTWREADGDITEAIDFLEYYGREAIRLSKAFRVGLVPGETNHYFYQPRGVGLVLAPWNFPLAIICGMTAGAIAAGNCAIMKPARQTPIIASKLMEAFRAAKLPDGVVQFLPGPGDQVGEFLASHRNVDFVIFTGSRDVGLHLIEIAGKTKPGQEGVKRVVAEMGGKNAVIVDSDADLDEAVAGVVYSAFGYQGQKCSACSRAIVLADAYDTFLSRLVEATKSLKVGLPEDPATKVGPVIDGKAQGSILDYIAKGKEEARHVITCDAPREGYFVGPTIFAEVPPTATIAREEIFGPVLSVMKAESFEEAIEIANGTDYALTGGLFSRSPARITRIRDEFRVGNLYINRGCTGALVERQPFGGFKMSGVGSKAGGPDYLLQFLEPRVVTENTMRRGFAPA